MQCPIILKAFFQYLGRFSNALNYFDKYYLLILTMTTESLAAIAKMSAHDATPGQAFSTAVFILSMTSKPLAEFLFAFEFFSPVKVAVSSRSTDPSQP